MRRPGLGMDKINNNEKEIAHEKEKTIMNNTDLSKIKNREEIKNSQIHIKYHHQYIRHHHNSDKSKSREKYIRSRSKSNRKKKKYYFSSDN